MNEDELPPIGARVRVSNEGLVVGHLSRNQIFEIEDDRGRRFSYVVGQRTVEVLSPPLPPEPEGDVVVLDRMGGLWRYKKDAWRHRVHFPQKWAELVALFGPVTVYRVES